MSTVCEICGLQVMSEAEIVAVDNGSIVAAIAKERVKEYEYVYSNILLIEIIIISALM